MYDTIIADNYLQIISLNLVLCLTKLVCLNVVFQSITRELNPVILSLIISLSFGSVSFSFYLMLTSLRKKVESAKNRGLKSLEIVHILTTKEHIVCLILYACRFYVSRDSAFGGGPANLYQPHWWSIQLKLLGEASSFEVDVPATEKREIHHLDDVENVP